jgi:hypothetical protein
MSNDYNLKFDLSSYVDLDNFALLADQSYNLGNKGDWFNQFRGGLGGLYTRILGVRIHYREIYSWKLPMSPICGIQGVEYHLSSILFNMDSAIECMVFALNALGYIANPTQFLDITNEKKLKQISPYNILGKPQVRVKGYDNYFPSLRNYWHDNRDLINKISEQHDVSKHRSTIFTGGRIRNDPPPRFFEKLGIEGDEEKQALVSPMAEILLTSQPKTPWPKRQPREYKEIDKLEDVTERFCTFINMCGVKVLEDARGRIKLNHYEFIKR